jgi:DNA-binding CsgD family transcriptional regulator
MDYCAALAPVLAQIPLACPGPDKRESSGSCLKAIEAAFFESCQQLGFPYARFSRWTRLIGDDGNPHYWYSTNFSNFPPEWELFYEKKALYMHDPVVRHIHEKAEDRLLTYGTWRFALNNAHEHPLGNTACEQEQYRAAIDKLFADAADHGLHHGCYFANSAGAHHVAVSLARADQPVADDDEVLWRGIFALTHLLNQSLALTTPCNGCSASVRTEGMPALQISPTQTRVLQLFLKQPAASVKEIANQLGTGPDAVNYHLKTLRQRLGKPGASGFALAQFAHEHHLV